MEFRSDWSAGLGRPGGGRSGLASALWLGVLALLGAGTEARADDALLRRAEAGDRGAQLALAVQLEAGGSAQAPEAIRWYTRAAARGDARAQYYLGQIFETGQGADRNPALARSWYAAAADRLPAAAGRLDRVAQLPPPDLPSRPRIVAATVSEAGETPILDLAWTSPPQPQGARFYVDVRAEDGDVLLTRLVERSAVAAPLPRGRMPCCARVVALDPDGARYAASGWTFFDPGEAPPAPYATEIRILVAGPGIDVIVDDIAADLAAAGIVAAILPEPQGDGGSASSIRYHYAEDGKIAQALAALLPGALQAVREPVDADAPPPPGRVDVLVVGAPPR